jgi:eukaryotic-like serine/threonine-protein kinase
VNIDNDLTADAESSASQPSQSGATLPLSPTEMDSLVSPTEMDSLDRTAGGEADAEKLDHTEASEEPTEPLGRTQGVEPPRSDGHKSLDRTEATALGRPTGGPPQKGGATGRRAPVGATRTRGSRTVHMPERIAGYEILSELGRGGMGVVYKARQAGLNRLCALKMILSGALASSDAIMRFKIEAEAIASLQHPNVVQVYEIGEADGCPYFSLEFVDGSNLQTKIASTPQPPAETALLMRQICLGVYAAHQRGVLHRDLKPANILLTKDNVPKITDFGLAKRIEEKDHGQTRTGAILGTPSYMAPEQAMGRAKDVGPAADIYSLGAVLYDMLTGRPPFRGETVMDTLNQVQKLEPLPPRYLAPKVPLDLQTICLKALQKEPHKRYETAGEMAEDLRRFGAGEPILARPTPAWERAAKWMKRRPAVASLIGISTTAAVSVLVLSGLWLETARVAAEDKADQQAQRTLEQQQARIKAEELKSQAVQERDVANQQRKLAEKRLTLGRKIVDDMLIRVGGPDLRYEPRMELVRRDLLEKGLGFYKDFLRDPGTDPALRFDTALANVQVGYIYRDLGQYDDALKQFQLALARFGDLQREHPTDVQYRRGVAQSTMDRAILWQLQNRLPESQQGYQEALDLVGGLARDYPESQEYQNELANLYDNRASLYLALGRTQEAEANYDTSLKLRNGMIAKGINDPESRKRLARLDRNRGALLMQVGKLPEAEKALVEARYLELGLTKEVPGVPDYVADWASTCMGLSLCYRKLGRPKPAAEELEQAIRLLTELKNDYPRTPEFRQELGRAHYELGMLQGEQGHLQQAQDEIAKALEIQEELLAKQPKLAAVRLQLAKSHISLGIAFSGLTKNDKALAQYRLGVDLLEKMKPTAAAAPDVCEELARGHENLAELQTALKNPMEADKSWGRLLTLRQQLVKAFPESLDKNVDLAVTHSLFAARYQKTGNKADAMPHWKDAAVLYARAMRLAGNNVSLAPERRKALQKDFGDNALGALQRAVEDGFAKVDQLKTAPEFELLRQRPEFQRLVNELQAKGADVTDKK